MRSLSEIIQAVRTLGQERDVVTVEDVVETFGRASTAVLLFIPAVVAATPLSGIPGLSALCGLTIAIVAAQAVVGRKSLWLPRFLMRRKVEGARVRDGLDKVGGIAAFLDRHTHERMHHLVRGPGSRMLLLLCMLGGMMMPFLEIIPFSASAVAICITVMSVALLTLDGLLAACALALVMLAAGGLTWLFI